jgi:hypothetical protein
MLLHQSQWETWCGYAYERLDSTERICLSVSGTTLLQPDLLLTFRDWSLQVTSTLLDLW